MLLQNPFSPTSISILPQRQWLQSLQQIELALLSISHNQEDVHMSEEVFPKGRLE